MKYGIVAHTSSPRIVETLPEDPITVRALARLTGAVNRIGRNEVLHLFLATILVALAIAAIV